MQSACKETVVVIPGLWMNGIECTLFRHRLVNDHGFNTCQYAYRTVHEGITENVEKLSAYLKTIRSESIHLVGHSLGGVLALKYLMAEAAEHPVDFRIGRVVCLGSPLTGSRAARGFLRLPWGAEFLGQMIRENVLENAMTEYTGQYDVGVIAGSLGCGLGQLFGSLDRPHDGTVSVSETRLPGITDHMEVNLTHAGLLLSRYVVGQTTWFLRHGKFSSD